MNRRIGILTALFTLIVLVIVGCGGAPTTPTTTATSPLVSPAATPTLGIGSKRVSDKDGMTLLYVPAGGFKTGAVDSEYLDDFWIDQTEVTNAMYAKCVTAGACRAPSSTGSYTRTSYYGNPQFDTYPVIAVTWNAAQQYCEWAGRRLPTNAEWKKAAHGNDYKHDYTNGEVGRDTTQVGDYPIDASLYGALDMAGNVSEWVAYRPSPYYLKELRGGSWRDGASVSIHGSVGNSAFQDFNIGFRCAH